ncbi:predicted protein [Plenodomus lingam JN3]|uniref:Predicted protein n=1 Tax=Leptosphaeria maculans (strain JN3 / isolate v23.1.3 / race Av1-4-5-6-7-8) TaxID=985895 RepID=E5ADU9_LEPMJ|nr:predicted protein [Plenodomus lingam JN3]CBY01388.1 predicted protein [Plenodomus lingam JN3]
MTVALRSVEVKIRMQMLPSMQCCDIKDCVSFFCGYPTVLGVEANASDKLRTAVG